MSLARDLRFAFATDSSAVQLWSNYVSRQNVPHQAGESVSTVALSASGKMSIVGLTSGRSRAFSDAFQQASLADAITYRLLTVAEKTGGLGPVLDRIAAFQESQVARAIDLISRLIEPAMMIFIGIVIGGIVVLMYMPIFEIASSVQ